MNLNITKVSAANRKIQIEQNVPSGSIRKGPYAIERSVDPNDVVIKRRFGEGSKPLFQRDDIFVNHKSITSATEVHSEKQNVCRSNTSPKNLSNRYRKERRNSTDSSSPERFEKYHNSHHECTSESNNSGSRRTKSIKSTSDRHGAAEKHTGRRASLQPSSHRKKTPEKLPYFIDEIRERDRLRRKYGTRPKQTSTSPPITVKWPRSRSGSKPSSRSHTPDSADKYKHRTNRFSTDTNRRGREKPCSDKIRNKTYAHNRHRSEDESRSDRRRRSSRSRSRSRDRSSRLHTQSNRDDRRKHRQAGHGGASNEEMNQTNLQQPQIITIPVPVPAEFMNYTYPTWPAPAQWAPQMTQPPRYGTPTAYHMPTILPAAVIPPFRPLLPPYGFHPTPLRYGGRGFRLPMQYGTSRPWRPNFRSKNT